MDADLETSDGSFVPQWKRELILRLRQKNKCLSPSVDNGEQLSTGTTIIGGSPLHRRGQGASSLQSPAGQQPSSSASAHSWPVSVGTGYPWEPLVGTNSEKCGSPSSTCISTSGAVGVDSSMVKERGVCGPLEEDSDSSEELRYGPGIVSRLKNRYLNLTLRETNNRAGRPSILPLRKATSLENLLDDDGPANGKYIV